MKLSKYSPIVLNDNETLLMLQEFCYEALRFLKVAKNRYPSFGVGIVTHRNANADPLLIDYLDSKVLVFIPIFKSLNIIKTGNDAPTTYRLLGYKIARYWYRFLKTGTTRQLDPIDIDSSVFALALATLKGLQLPLGLLANQVIDLLKNEIGIECELVDGCDVISRTKLKVLRYTSSQQKKVSECWEKRTRDSNSRLLETISDGQQGSKSNPFSNVDEAAAYILKIEEERLASDPYRQAIASEEYFYDGNAFRIPWASANVAYYPIEGNVRNAFVVSQLSTHNKFALKPILAHNKFLYRGQAQFYSPCKSNLFRESKEFFIDDTIQVNEMRCLLQTHPLVQLLEQGFELLHDTFRIMINYKGLSQHYYNKTSLLDLTSDMEVAKFFAVTSFNMREDRYEKYAGGALGVLYYFDLKPDSFQYGNKCNHIVENIGKQLFMRSGNQFGFLINVGKNEDFNKYQEVRYVFFRHDSAITDRIFAQFDKGDKIMPEEILRSHWYTRINDEHARKIVSSDALKLSFKDNPYESHSQVVKKLREKGFRIKNYHPSFSEEELSKYYATSLESWEEFCSNVLFYSPEGALMKEHLINLPNDPRYRWAFVRET